MSRLPDMLEDPWLTRPHHDRVVVEVGSGPVVVQRYRRRGSTLVVVEGRGHTLAEASRATEVER